MEPGDIREQTRSNVALVSGQGREEERNTYMARESEIAMAGNRVRFLVRDDPTGDCWNIDTRRVLVASRLKHCMRTRLIVEEAVRPLASRRLSQQNGKLRMNALEEVDRLGFDRQPRDQVWINIVVAVFKP